MKNKYQILKRESSKLNAIRLFSLILLFMIFISVFSFNVSALGISPAKKTIDFNTDEQDFTYTIINNEHKDMTLEIYAIGDLADYFEFNVNKLEITSSEETKDFIVSIKLPSDLNPGERTGKIVVEEFIPISENIDTQVYAKFKVLSVITVNAPYPDKYIDVEIDLKDTEKGKPLDIVTRIKNLGAEDIENLQTTFGIYEDNKILESKENPSETLKQGSALEFVTTLDTNAFEEGEYSAIATVNYDNYVLEIGKDFKVGKEYVSILDYTKYFLMDTINKFDVDVMNKWNKKIRNAYAQILIENGNVAELKSVSYDLNPNEKAIITSYWDTKGVELGDYDSNITLYYVNKSTEELGKVHVVLPEEYPSAKKSDSMIWIVIIVTAIFVSNIALLLIIMRKNKDKGKGRKVYKQK